MPFQTGASQKKTSQPKAAHGASSRLKLTIGKAIKSHVGLGLGLASLVVVVLVHWVPELAITLPVFGLMAFGYWLQQQWQQDAQQKQKRQAQIDAKFYQLLQQQQGRISLLDFAMRTKLKGGVAQDYLNRQAEIFSAYAETGLAGNIIYVFNPLAMQADTRYRSNPAEAVWAYAEQARSEKVKTEKTYAAWANAKQIRTLQQLSQPTKKISTDKDTEKLKGLKSPRTSHAQSATQTNPKVQRVSKSASAAEAPKAVRAGYIAISTPECDRQDNRSPDQAVSPKNNQTPKIKTHRAVKLPGRDYPSTPAGDRVVTIDVSAVGE